MRLPCTTTVGAVLAAAASPKGGNSSRRRVSRHVRAYPPQIARIGRQGEGKCQNCKHGDGKAQGGHGAQRLFPRFARRVPPFAIQALDETVKRHRIDSVTGERPQKWRSETDTLEPGRAVCLKVHETRLFQKRDQQRRTHTRLLPQPGAKFLLTLYTLAKVHETQEDSVQRDTLKNLPHFPANSFRTRGLKHDCPATIQVIEYNALPVLVGHVHPVRARRGKTLTGPSDGDEWTASRERPGQNLFGRVLVSVEKHVGQFYRVNQPERSAPRQAKDGPVSGPAKCLNPVNRRNQARRLKGPAAVVVERAQIHDRWSGVEVFGRIEDPQA